MNTVSEENILVSIICNTYNQEDYIADALESFIMQKTNFKFEILVHDDASTDRTADIVREYEKKYPELIKPIYQTENQYSQRNGMIAKLQYGRAEGKYLAFCEGDDYWTDEHKLQKQADFMEAHPEYSLCVHSASVIDGSSGEFMYEIKVSDTDRDMTVDEIIMRWGFELPTNSMMYRRKLRDDYPAFLLKAPVGDYPLTMYLSFCGKVRYMSDNMSSYRYMAKGSWSTRLMAESEESWRRRIDLLTGFVDMLNKVDEYTEFKYHNTIKLRIVEYNIDMLKFSEKCGDKELAKKYYDCLPLKRKFLHSMEKYMPHLIELYTRLRSKNNAGE